MITESLQLSLHPQSGLDPEDPVRVVPGELQRGGLEEPCLQCIPSEDREGLRPPRTWGRPCTQVNKHGYWEAMHGATHVRNTTLLHECHTSIERKKQTLPVIHPGTGSTHLPAHTSAPLMSLHLGCPPLSIMSPDNFPDPFHDLQGLVHTEASWSGAGCSPLSVQG